VKSGRGSSSSQSSNFSVLSISQVNHKVAKTTLGRKGAAYFRYARS
jgi:hypothetical protein